MKVIRAGEIKPKRCECYHCGAQLEYTISDTIKKTSTKWNGEPDFQHFVDAVQCPLCGKMLELDRCSEEDEDE